MLSFPLKNVSYPFNGYEVTVLVPDEAAVKKWYEANRNANAPIPFPYWAKLWPAAVGMCRYLATNRHLVQGKTVLELGAGLGLPSLLAARYAFQVYCTDISPEAVLVVQQAAAQNNLHNLKALTLDWNSRPATLKPDVLLISDVNYNPELFDSLYAVLGSYLDAGTLIVLSTPQRLMAKPFIERLVSFCSHQKTVPVTTVNESIDISIMLLQLNL